MLINTMINKNANTLFKCLLKTIKSLDHSNLSDDGISEVLEELEGDYYTFMQVDNLNFLEKNGYIKISDITSILKLRAKIQALPNNLWTIESFRNSIRWQYIRNDAAIILKEIEILKE